MVFKQRPGPTMGQQIFRIAINGAEAQTSIPGLAFTVTGSAGPNLGIVIAPTTPITAAAWNNNPLVVAKIDVIGKGSPALSSTVYSAGGATLTFGAVPSGFYTIEVTFDRAKNAFPEPSGYFA